jgi:hypothetical protein
LPLSTPAPPFRYSPPPSYCLGSARRTCPSRKFLLSRQSRGNDQRLVFGAIGPPLTAENVFPAPHHSLWHPEALPPLHLPLPLEDPTPGKSLKASLPTKEGNSSSSGKKNEPQPLPLLPHSPPPHLLSLRQTKSPKVSPFIDEPLSKISSKILKDRDSSNASPPLLHHNLLHLLLTPAPPLKNQKTRRITLTGQMTSTSGDI